MSSESIALITARASKLERGNGGLPEITEADICYALALLRANGAALLLRVKIAGQEKWRPKLIAELHQADGRSSEQLCQLAVEEYCSPALCSTCNGRESHKVGALLIVCETCNGSGKHGKPCHALHLGISDADWSRIEDRYSRLLSRLSSWEGMGIAMINSIKDEE